MMNLRGSFILILLSTLLLLVLIAALALGSVTIAPSTLIEWALHPGHSLDARLVMELRLPRALNAIAIGGLLGLAGAILQILLRNPLADPYILGVSGGASLGALTSMLLGLGSLLLSTAAFGGALVSMLLVFLLTLGQRQWSPTRLLLNGVVMASGWGALIVLLLSLAPARQLPGMLFWLMGDLGYAGSPWPGLALLVVALLIVVPLGRSLDIMLRGSLQAEALGVAVKPLGWLLYVMASLMTAVAVMNAGSIGFVGLITPHLMRLVIGNRQQVLLPASALGGALLLLIADTLGRTLIAPQQLSAGVITVLLGVPVFMFMLRRDKGL